MNKEQDMNWQDTQKWADQKIAGLLAIAQRQGDKLIVGADPRDLLTTKEQQLELMQQQAVLLRQRVDQNRQNNRQNSTRFAPNLTKKPTKSSQDELFDLFAERLAKKLGELNNKKPQE
jgi:glucan phosphorylase